MSQLSKDETKRMLGYVRTETDKLNTKQSQLTSLGTPPSSVDWRDKNGNWVTPVKNQESCGYCWVFSSVAVAESRAKIDLNNPSYSINLSEQDVASCASGSNGGLCDGATDGGNEITALIAMKDIGIVKESCFPYSGSANECSNKCSNWQNEKMKISNYNSVSGVTPIKQAINDYGPVTVYMAVYEDFMAYSGGVYSWAYGDYLGYHSISIVGYNDAGQYWICKNSWGTGWGESGYFRISYSENVLNYDTWYNDPYDNRTFFLDDSYYVTGTDIGTIPAVNSAQANITYANSSTPINFTVYAKANSIKQLSSVKLNGTSMSGTLSTGGTFSTIKTLSDFGCQGFEGNCILTINATDDAGKANTNEKITVVVDDIAPRVTANPTVYPDNQNAARNGSLIALNATIIDFGAGVQNAMVNASQVNGSLGNIILNNISGFWTNSSVILNTSDGIYYLNITAHDNVGNLNDTEQITVIVDNTPPNVSEYLVSYQRGSAANNHSIIGFNASADDPLINSTSAGLKNAHVNASLINNTGRIELTNQSGIWRGNATFDKFQPDGYYLLNVTFFDNAGNKNNSVQINVSIDNTPPSVADVSVSSQFINVTGFTNISANITSLDTVSQVNQSEVFVRVTYPNGTSINYQMENASGSSLFYYNFTDTAQYGRFIATILANDTTGNINSTQIIQFATVFITNNENVVTKANNLTVVNAPLSNTTLYLFTNNTSVGAINITQSRINITSNELNITNPGIYVNVNVSSSIRKNLSYVKIYVNYTDAEVSSYVENTLRLYRWNTSSLSWDRLAGTGSYPYVNNAGVDTANNFVLANLTELSEFAVSGELYVPPPQETSSNGGGGGGGGGSSGEDYYNIVLSETDRQSVYKNSHISYRFDLEGNIVKHINFTALNSVGKVAAKVEILNNTSTLVSTLPPYEVFRNLNMWVGNAGWATERNIADATVVFTVEKTWITENNIDESSITLYRYSADTWHELVTRKIIEDANSMQFEAETPRFSPFAVSGKTIESRGKGIIEPTVTAEKTPIPKPTEKKGIPGFNIFAGLSVLLIAVQLLRKKK